MWSLRGLIGGTSDADFKDGPKTRSAKAIPPCNNVLRFVQRNEKILALRGMASTGIKMATNIVPAINMIVDTLKVHLIFTLKFDRNRLCLDHLDHLDSSRSGPFSQIE